MHELYLCLLAIHQIDESLALEIDNFSTLNVDVNKIEFILKPVTLEMISR